MSNQPEVLSTHSCLSTKSVSVFMLRTYIVMYIYLHVHVRVHTQDMLSEGICGISAVKARNVVNIWVTLSRCHQTEQLQVTP